MRVCQFRHDGNLDCNAAAAQGRRVRKANFSILQPGHSLSNQSHSRHSRVLTRAY
jgi:hypothetical protein